MKRLSSTIHVIMYLLVFGFVITLNSCKKDEINGDHDQTVNNAIYLDGVGDYVEVYDDSYIDLANEFTIELWIKPNDVSGQRNLIGKQWCTDEYAFNLSLDDGKLIWEWNGTDGNCTSNNVYESLNVVVANNEKKHIAIVHNETSVNMYVNGVLVFGTLSSGSYSQIINSSEPIRIGAYKLQSGDISNFYKGAIDDVRIWEWELTENEIREGKDLVLIGSQPGLIALYDMENSEDGDGKKVYNIITATADVLDGVTHGTDQTPYYDSF